MSRPKQKKKRTTEILAALCFTMALVSLLSAAGATLAKYIRQDAADKTVVPTPFYFSSDKLGDNDPYYQINELGENESLTIDFTLNNYVDRFRCTTETINYTYWVSSGSQPSGAMIGSAQSGSLSGTMAGNTCHVTVTGRDFDADGQVIVVARSANPYQKTLTARFGFTPQEHSLQKRVVPDGNAVVLEISGGNNDRVRVTWDSTILSPDPANSIFQGDTPGTVTFTAEPGVRYALTFLKLVSAEITDDSFEVTTVTDGE